MAWYYVMFNIIQMTIHHGNSQGFQNNTLLIIERVVIKEGTYEMVILNLL
jgi:hypothetical protein